MIEYPKPEPRDATVLERILATGISEERARQKIERGQVRVGEDVVTDPDAPLPWPTAYVFVS